MAIISGSVGNQGRNNLHDVVIIQGLINKNIKLLPPLLPLKTDGVCGPVTIGVIKEFQRKVLNIAQPDGRVEPNSKILEALENGATAGTQSSKISAAFNTLLLTVQQYLKTLMPALFKTKDEKPAVTLTEADYQNAASQLSVEVATIKAIASVESSGSGFLNNGAPKILFEGHIFSDLTDGAYDKKYPTISYPKWTKAFYLGGVAEYTRYNTAFSLDKNAAMMSASWGKFQIMGLNYAKAGYGSVEQFVQDMYKSEANHLLALVKFLKANGLDVHLRSKNWAKFAEGYNGPQYAKNKYDIRLKQAYEAFTIKH